MKELVQKRVTQWRILMERINYELLGMIDSHYGTPFYIMQPEVYRNNINRFLDAFRCRYERIIAGYSFKTNFVPALCKVAKEEGCWAEVVSKMEYHIARRIGFDNIIFNGPIKTEDILWQALDDGCLVNLDSRYEIDSVLRYKNRHQGETVFVGLRVNIDVSDSDTCFNIQNGLRVGRFGFTKKDLKDVIPLLKNNGILIKSIHGHTSSSDRAVNNYKVISRYMLKVCEDFELDDIEFFDVGGGFFGAPPKGLNLTNKPQYQDYANCILDEVLTNAWFNAHTPYIVIEPGSSVVSNVFSFVSKIYQTKHIADKNFAVIDGSVFDVKPTMHSNNLPFKVLQSEVQEGSLIYDVVGSTCMEKDVILSGVIMPRVGFGDYIIIDGVGAYTIALTPTFINYQAPIISYDNGTIQLIRRRQNDEDVLSAYIY